MGVAQSLGFGPSTHTRKPTKIANVFGAAEWNLLNHGAYERFSIMTVFVEGWHAR